MVSFICKPPSNTFCIRLGFTISIILLLVLHLFTNQPNNLPQNNIVHLTTRQSTNISHLVFGIVGSTEAWYYRKGYIESWWRPNVTRGYLYLDTNPTNDLLPWSQNSPPFRVSDDLSKLLNETKHAAPIMVRMVHAIIEVFREEQEDVRWYIMGDDDSLFFVDNLVDVLSKYDHTKYIYIGGHSEFIMSNHWYSTDMGFGGAGLIMSYPLVKVVQKNIENCFRRYPYLTSADHILMTCVNDFGVSMTTHQGLHQIDLNGDISGLLSSHPKAPLLSLHHFDNIDPLFPTMNRVESTKHLMKASNVDQARLLQQTICYNRHLSWSFSVSWGYSIHIYERIIPRSFLKIPLETFKPWHPNFEPPLYMFNTRRLTNNSCLMPHMFSFDSIKRINDNEVLTSYVREGPRWMPTCGLGGSHSADLVFRIEVVSPVTKPKQDGKTECCDVIQTDDMDFAKLKLRDCMDDELIA
ncbi:uncharacterized protein [Rutidosis leptorrhynchoides]|uniref:uncharacterized protein n=1 Tax=Rutidosis leptorrhynchoides TaxID=125765 RepID=UPI003A99E6C3